ncbi:MAG: hypothetical protein L3K16_07795 [Thermoplasmata archaeon]|nr:hypothetical protein [Thermoplasmata archaeon]
MAASPSRAREGATNESRPAYSGAVAIDQTRTRTSAAGAAYENEPAMAKVRIRASPSSER